MNVAIVGGGACGLASLKICIDCRLNAVCFEKSENIGGLWRYAATSKPEKTTVMKTTITNTSKEMMAFSDFLPPDDFPVYMLHSKFLEYLELYADRFNLKQYIEFETSVISIDRGEDFEKSGRWKLHLSKSNKNFTQIFDAVLLCTGIVQQPNVPLYEGEEKFRGTIRHSCSYKTSNPYHNRNVLIVGIGNTAADIAVDLSQHAKQVHLSIRDGSWCFGRSILFGLPKDMILMTRFVNFIVSLIGKRIFSSLLQILLNLKFDHRRYGLGTDQGLSIEKSSLTNDNLPNRIFTGQVLMKPNMKKFLNRTTIELEDGSVLKDIDDVILCTGYKVGFPLLPEDLVDLEDLDGSMFKYFIPINQKYTTLFIIGYYRASGAVSSIAEIQARVACEILVGKVTISIGKRKNPKADKSTAFIAFPKVHYAKYMDELAEIICVKPSLWKIFLTDPVLWKSLMFDPITPYQYRLEGQDNWHGARKAQIEVWNRALHQLKSGRKIKTEKSNCFRMKLILFVLFIGLVFTVLYHL